MGANGCPTPQHTAHLSVCCKYSLAATAISAQHNRRVWLKHTSTRQPNKVQQHAACSRCWCSTTDACDASNGHTKWGRRTRPNDAACTCAWTPTMKQSKRQSWDLRVQPPWVAQTAWRLLFAVTVTHAITAAAAQATAAMATALAGGNNAHEPNANSLNSCYQLAGWLCATPQNTDTSTLHFVQQPNAKCGASDQRSESKHKSIRQCGCVT